jgi:methionine aminotransferase
MGAPQIKSKLPKVGTTIFTVMSALAQEYGAINLGQGFPDFDMPKDLIGLVDKAMHEGFNQYVPMQGYLPLRQTLATKVNNLYSAQVDPQSEITITPGGTYAIYTALTCFLNPGDEVIVFEPCYDSYIPNIETNGAKVISISLLYPEYKVDWDAFRKAINEKTKAVIINNPHNPTGTVWTAEDMKELENSLRGTNIIVVSDEVYEHLVYDNIKHESILKYPELFKRSFVCFSMGKVFHCTGWKIGYCISNNDYMQEFRKIHQFNCFSTHSPSQVALSAYLKTPENYLQLSSFLQQKRDYFKKMMSETRFDLMPCSGSYFITAKYNRISEESDLEFCKRMTKEYGVTAIPVSAFYSNQKDDRVIRFCFAKKETTLEEAVERLAAV